MGCFGGPSGSASSPSASELLPSYYDHIRIARTGQIGRGRPTARRLFGARRLPGIRCLPKDSPPPEPSPGTVLPLSAHSGHIEPSSLAATISYTAFAGTTAPSGKATDIAPQKATNQSALLPSSAIPEADMDANIAAPPLPPLAAQPLPALVASTRARFGCRVYESKRCFQSALASSHLDSTTESLRQDITATTGDVQDSP